MTDLFAKTLGSFRGIGNADSQRETEKLAAIVEKMKAVDDLEKSILLWKSGYGLGDSRASTAPLHEQLATTFAQQALFGKKNWRTPCNYYASMTGMDTQPVGRHSSQSLKSYPVELTIEGVVKQMALALGKVHDTCHELSDKQLWDIAEDGLRLECVKLAVQFQRDNPSSVRLTLQHKRYIALQSLFHERGANIEEVFASISDETLFTLAHDMMFKPLSYLGGKSQFQIDEVPFGHHVLRDRYAEKLERHLLELAPEEQLAPAL